MTGLRIVTTTNVYKRTPDTCGEYWQRCLVRTADGELVYVLVPDELLPAAVAA